MNVLVINCGSSSLKYQLINSDTEDVLAKGLCERIGIDGRLVYQKAGLDKEITECAMPTHKEAIQFVLDALTNEKTGAIKSLKEVDAIGHRVVHGGEKFAASAVITDEMIAAVKECNDLAPLHNPANLIGIDVCSELMPGVPQVGVFDTAFHQTMPAKAYLYGLPIEYYKKYKVRRYGFHGTSHSFVSKRAVEFLGLDKDNSKVIVCHLGNGSSISAVQNGKCVDTTMGLTPLEGVVMGTRSGNIDPAIVEFIAKKENLDIAGVMNVLNKKSGLQGMSGVGSDMRDIRAAIADGNEDAKNAYDVLCYGIAKFVGANKFSDTIAKYIISILSIFVSICDSSSDVTHITADSGHTLKTGFLVQHIHNTCDVKVFFLCNEFNNCRINITGTSSHNNALKWCKSHSCIYTFAVLNSTDRRSVSKMANNNFGVVFVKSKEFYSTFGYKAV